MSAFLNANDVLDKGASEAEAKEEARIAEKLAREQEREANRINNLRNSFLTEQQLVEEQHAAKMATFAEFAEIEGLTEEEARIRKEELEQAHQERINKIRLDGMTENQRIMEMSFGAQAQLVGAAFGDFLSIAGQGNEKFLKASRIAGAAQAFVATLVGQAEALKLGWPLGPIAALKIAGTGFGLVNAIKGGGKGGGGGRGGLSSGATSLSAPQIQQAAPARKQTTDIRIQTGGRRLFTDEDMGQIIGGIVEQVRNGDNRIGQVLIQ